jgi:hypothetical protein
VIIAVDVSLGRRVPQVLPTLRISNFATQPLSPNAGITPAAPFSAKTVGFAPEPETTTCLPVRSLFHATSGCFPHVRAAFADIGVFSVIDFHGQVLSVVHADLMAVHVGEDDGGGLRTGAVAGEIQL